MSGSASQRPVTGELVQRVNRTRVLCLSLLLALGLAACGGAGEDPGGARADSAAFVWPLLDDNGLLMPSHPAAVPVDPAARTRAQRYASVEQAGMLVEALGPAVVQVEVDCCNAGAVSLAVMRAAAAQAGQPGAALVPVLVRGADLRLAATVADRLAEEGMPTVFLVTR